MKIASKNILIINGKNKNKKAFNDERFVRNWIMFSEIV